MQLVRRYMHLSATCLLHAYHSQNRHKILIRKIKSSMKSKAANLILETGTFLAPQTYRDYSTYFIYHKMLTRYRRYLDEGKNKLKRGKYIKQYMIW